MDPYIGEIRVFAGNFAPKGWAFCDGQVLPISQNTALFSILGTIYGGDGRTTFALPDLRGRASMHQGNGPGLTPRTIGEIGGNASVTLTENEIPNHTHAATCQSDTTNNQGSPINATWANAGGRRASSIYSDFPTSAMAQTIQTDGGNQPHNNMQPYLGLNFIIALEGVYPSHS